MASRCPTPQHGQLAAARQADGIAISPAPEATEAVWQPRPRLGELRERIPTHKPFEHWWISSYSALAVGGEVPESAFSEQLLDDERSQQFQPLRPGETPTIHRFPRGPQPGTFLHGLLELAGRESFARFADPQTSREHLRPRCIRRGWAEWGDRPGDWLAGLLRRPGLVDTELPPILPAAVPRNWFVQRRAGDVRS